MYIKRLLLVTVVFVAGAFLTGKVFDGLYKKRWSTLFFKGADTLTKGKTNYDILLLGNSRVHFGLNPYYIDSVTGLSSFNLGIGGGDAEVIRMQSAAYLGSHAAPKVAVIALEENTLRGLSRLNTLYHLFYYLHNDSIAHYMQSTPYPIGMIKTFPFLKYSFFDEYNRTSLFVKGETFPVFKHNMYKGFLNIYADTSNDPKLKNDATPDTVKVTPAAVQNIEAFISMFQQRGTKVMIVLPPARKSTYQPSTHNAAADSVFKMLHTKYGVPVIDLILSGSYPDKYFSDDIHLNYPGTTIFSIEVADSINRLIAD